LPIGDCRLPIGIAEWRLPIGWPIADWDRRFPIDDWDCRLTKRHPAVVNHQSFIPIINRRSQSTIVNPNRAVRIRRSQSPIGNRQSAISAQLM
jgi:hypothetical protein